MWPKRSFFLQQKALVFFALLTHTFGNSQQSILNVLFWKFEKWAKSCWTIVFFLARKKVGDPSWTKWFNERISKSKHFPKKKKQMWNISPPKIQALTRFCSHGWIGNRNCYERGGMVSSWDLFPITLFHVASREPTLESMFRKSM